MREIEFRGKNSANEWLYGYLTKQLGSDCFIIESQDCLGGVIEETIGQYTGLKDKNGTKIYEGDILCMTFSNEWTHNEERKIYYSVKFTDGMFATFYKDYENGQWEDIEDNRLDKALIEVDKLEVVGNIYDNPELLGDGDDIKE